MRSTLEKLNELLNEGIIEKYAIGGGIGDIFTILKLVQRMTLMLWCL